MSRRQPVMHADQLRIDADQVAELVAREADELAGLPVREVASAGTVNAIFRIGDHVAARFPLQPDEPLARRTQLEREQRRTRRFRRVSPRPAPTPLGVFAPGAGYPSPWSMQTWVEGEVADPVALAGSDRFADDLVCLWGTLRSIDVSGERTRGYGRGDVLAPFDEYVRDGIERSRGIIDASAVSRVWRELMPLSAPHRLAFSHTDLIPGNILVSGGRLAGLLDTGDASASDPALDLVAAWHLFDAPRRERIRVRLGSDDAEWQRGRAWALVQAIGLGWYYTDTNPTMAALGRSTLARVVEG